MANGWISSSGKSRTWKIMQKTVVPLTMFKWYVLKQTGSIPFLEISGPTKSESPSKNLSHTSCSEALWGSRAEEIRNAFLVWPGQEATQRRTKMQLAFMFSCFNIFYYIYIFAAKMLVFQNLDVPRWLPLALFSRNMSCSNSRQASGFRIKWINTSLT